MSSQLFRAFMQKRKLMLDATLQKQEQTPSEGEKLGGSESLDTKTPLDVNPYSVKKFEPSDRQYKARSK